MVITDLNRVSYRNSVRGTRTSNVNARNGINIDSTLSRRAVNDAEVVLCGSTLYMTWYIYCGAMYIMLCLPEVWLEKWRLEASRSTGVLSGEACFPVSRKYMYDMNSNGRQALLVNIVNIALLRGPGLMPRRLV
jgi:hypothetical protein